MKNASLFSITFGLVLLSRIPFLDAGYGIDPDAWRVVNAARVIGATHEYVASRLPGNPFQEVCYSLLGRDEPILFNGITALFSAAGTGLFVLILRKVGSKDPVLVGMALAFTPAVFINSVNSMDYVWALAFILGSMYSALHRRALLAGILLGLAVGCRITSGAMAIPLSIVLASSDGGKEIHWKEVGQFLIGVALVSAVVFSPVWRKYGIGILTFNDGYPSLTAFLRAAAYDVWGVIGLLAVIPATIAAMFSKNGEGAGESSVPKAWIVAWLVAIGLYGIAFLRLPGEAGYLIPALPFVFLLFQRYLHRRFLVAVCVAVIASSFLAGVDSTDRPWSVSRSKFSAAFTGGGRELAIDLLNGPILNDRLRRLGRMHYAERVIAYGRSDNRENIIVSGVWFPQIVGMLNGQLGDNTDPSSSYRSGSTTYVGLLDGAAVAGHIQQEHRLFYIKGQEEYSMKVLGVNLVELGAKELMVR